MISDNTQASQNRCDGMQAMSNEEIAKRQLELARDMLNAYPDLAQHQLAQASQNWWAQCRGEVPIEPIHIPERPTLWARLVLWLRSTPMRSEKWTTKQ